MRFYSVKTSCHKVVKVSFLTVTFKMLVYRILEKTKQRTENTHYCLSDPGTGAPE